MSRTRYNKVLLVAPEISSHQMSADYKNVKHVYAVNSIFPSIFELNPSLIVFDYNYLCKDMEKIVRRIRTNNFYAKIKICCYKTRAELKTDGLLKAIGVDFFIYEEELKTVQKSKNIAGIYNILNVSALKLAAPGSN